MSVNVRCEIFKLFSIKLTKFNPLLGRPATLQPTAGKCGRSQNPTREDLQGGGNPNHGVDAARADQRMVCALCSLRSCRKRILCSLRKACSLSDATADGSGSTSRPVVDESVVWSAVWIFAVAGTDQLPRSLLHQSFLHPKSLSIAVLS